MTYHAAMTSNCQNGEMSDLLPPQEAAKALGVTYCTLNTWRVKGCPHELVPYGLKQVARYRLGDVRAWLEDERKKTCRKNNK